jgi:hypothetical protein
MNMHSAYGTHRYFVYHSEVGTSFAFTNLEQEYIEGVRFYYLTGIEPWYYKITWTNGTPTYYPESWFWLNYQEAVMALTYEDWNDIQAHGFDSTANAILRGIADYLDLTPVDVLEDPQHINTFELAQNYPNPFNPRTKIKYDIPIKNYVDLSIFNQLGQKIATLASEVQAAGTHQVEWNAAGLPSGIYYYRLQSGEFFKSRKMIFLK